MNPIVQDREHVGVSRDVELDQCLGQNVGHVDVAGALGLQVIEHRHNGIGNDFLLGFAFRNVDIQVRRKLADGSIGIHIAFGGADGVSCEIDIHCIRFLLSFRLLLTIARQR